MEQENEVAAVEEGKFSKVMERRINVRLPEETIAMIDSAVENGLAASRSDGIRKILTTFQNMGGPNKGIIMSFMAHILNEPLEFFIWLKDRANLLSHDDDWRRREAGLMTLFMKAAAIKGEILDKINLPEIRERLVSTMSSFDGFNSLPEGAILAPPAKGGSVAPAFEVLVSHIIERIRSGADAHEISDRLISLIMLAGTFDYYESDGVDPVFSMMAAAADIQDYQLGDQADIDVDAFDSAYENFCLLVPELYDNQVLREDVRLYLHEHLLRVTRRPLRSDEIVAIERADQERADQQEESTTNDEKEGEGIA